jgi:methylmalonyl-CoA mutase N-terminal domain/subunit
LPTEQSVQIALRTQQIIAYETGVADTIDPLAGSYYVESLTDEIERKAREYIEKIDDMGGAVTAIEQGYPQREIHDSAFEFQKRVDAQKRVVVGVNMFAEKGKQKLEYLKVNPEVEKEQVTAVKRVREKRSSGPWKDAMKGLKTAAQSNANLMPAIITAVKAQATVGEICDVFRQLWGEYKAPDMM